jgi:hypothetical protein
MDLVAYMAKQNAESVNTIRALANLKQRKEE